MVVGGWYDTEDLYGPLHTYRAIEKQNPGISNTLVMGPWPHGGWTRTDGSALGDAEFGFQTSNLYQELELAFFKHHLKGGEKPELPEALVFETGANRWRRFDAWPPKQVRETAALLPAEGRPVVLGAPVRRGVLRRVRERPEQAGALHRRSSPPGWSKNYMTEDQRFASRRPDVLVYQTEPLEKDLTLAGPMEAELWVSTTGTDADWVVKLVDVNPGRMPGFSREDAAEGNKNRGASRRWCAESRSAAASATATASPSPSSRAR